MDYDFRSIPFQYLYFTPKYLTPNYIPPKYFIPNFVEQYMGNFITASINGLGKVIAKVSGFNESTGMIKLIVYTSSDLQHIEVYHEDMYEISPYQEIITEADDEDVID